MYPIIMERDTDIVDWGTLTPGLNDADVLANSVDYLVKSLGVLDENYATLHSGNNTGVIGAADVRCVGVHITGPEDGTDLTPYAVSVHAQCAEQTVRPFLFIGESPATITSAAAGDTVTDVRRIAFPIGPTLDREFVVLVAQKTAGRGLCFGIAIMADILATSNLPYMIHMNVRRLIGVDPMLIDTRKL